MTRLLRFGVACLGLSLVAASGVSENIVLRGGMIISVKQPPVRRGNNVILTRVDGTVLSVPATEIDREATAAARSVVAAPSAPLPLPAVTLVGAARASREVPKARLRITDADVEHGEAAAASAAPAEEGAAGKASQPTGGGRVEVGDYTQEQSGEALVVRGSLRNPGVTPAMNVRMTVAALDAKGQSIASTEAGVSADTIDPSGTAAFSATLPVGERVIGSIRFTPRWIAAAPPAPDAAARDASGAGASANSAAPAAATTPRSSAPPPPEPTPYGRGTLYAAPPASAPSEAPKDGKSGYLPGASHPGNQPKPPN